MYPLVVLVVGVIVTTLNLVESVRDDNPDFVDSAHNRNCVGRDLCGHWTLRISACPTGSRWHQLCFSPWLR